MDSSAVVVAAAAVLLGLARRTTLVRRVLELLPVQLALAAAAALGREEEERPVQARAGAGSASLPFCLYHRHCNCKAFSKCSLESPPCRVGVPSLFGDQALSFTTLWFFRPAQTRIEQGATSMASNGFAPPPPRPATVESVETANLKTSSSPSSSNAVVAFHTRLIEELLADLRTLAPRRPAHQGEPLTEALSKADSWASLRILLRAKLGPPGVALLNGDVETFTATAQVVLAALGRIGAAQLARECGDLDDQNASRTDASGSSAADDGARWHGLCDLLAWLSAVRSAFVGETAPMLVPTFSLYATCAAEFRLTSRQQRARSETHRPYCRRQSRAEELPIASRLAQAFLRIRASTSAWSTRPEARRPADQVSWNLVPSL